MRWHHFLASWLTTVLALASLSAAGAVETRVSFEERRDIHALINSLGTSDNVAFLRTSRALREKGRKAVPFLISTLTVNPNPKVRHQIARVLAEIRDDRGIDALFQASVLDPDDAVRKIAEASLDALIGRLNAPQLGKRVQKDYGRFDRQSIYSLRKRLKTDRVPSVRQRAAQTLAEYGDERDLDALFEVAKGDNVAAVRLEAAKAIVKIAYTIVLNSEYRVTFFGTLTDGPDSFRERIVRSLINLLREERDGSVRLETVKGLTRLVYPTFLIGEEGFGPALSLKVRSREVIVEVRDCLLSLLQNDRSAPVRKEAAVSLSKLFTALLNKGDEVSNEKLRRSLLGLERVRYVYPYPPGGMSHFRQRSFRYLPARAEHLLKPVRDALSKAYSTDRDPGVRREAVIGLTFLGRKKDLRVVLRHLPHERSEDVWLASIDALGQLGGGTAAKTLLNVYRRPSNSAKLRKAAVLSIGKIGTRNIVRNLASFVAREPNREVKLAILEALGYQRDEGTAAVLAKACQDKSSDVRAAAARAAGGNFTDETIPVLKRLLMQDADEKVRAAACTSLSKAIGKEAADLFIAALDDESPTVRRAAAVELRIHKIAKAQNSLVSILLNDLAANVRAEAATSLGGIGGVKSVQPLVLAVAKDLSAFVRRQALGALLKTREPRTATIAILAILPKLAAENPTAYQELNNLLPDLRRQAHGREMGEEGVFRTRYNILRH